MAKVTPSPAIESISGRLCNRSQQCIALNRHTGKMVMYDFHQGTSPNTEAQQQVRTTFTQKSKAASAWWAVNKPKTASDPGTEDYQSLMKAYKQQRAIGNPYSYLRSLVSDDLQVVLPGSTSSAPVTPPSGGGSSSSGGDKHEEL